VETELGRIDSELADSAPLEPPDTEESALKAWPDASPLVSSPFLLSPEFEIIWPRGNGELSNEQLSFLRWNSDFLSNLVEVPVYENIALAYKEEIVPAAKDQEGIGQMEFQQAKSQFEMSEEVKEKIYEQALEEGRKAQSRIVVPSASGAVNKEEPPPSIFISRDLRLDEITTDRDLGLIPRFVENRLSLLFWKKLTDGRIIGCVISDSELRARLVAPIPDVYTPVRCLFPGRSNHQDAVGADLPVVRVDSDRRYPGVENGAGRDCPVPSEDHLRSQCVSRIENTPYLDPYVCRDASGGPTAK
jgi:hypothetical protein